MKNSIKTKNIFFFTGVFFLILIWFIVASIINNDMVVPNLDNTFKALFVLLSEKNTYVIIGNTLLRLFISVLCSLAIALLLATLSSLSDKVEYFIKPFIVLLKTLPIVVILILLLIVLKNELTSYFIVGLVVLPLIYEATLSGIKRIDKDIIDNLKTETEINLNIVVKVHLPLAFPYVLTSLIQSFGLGLKVLVMAEFISQPANSIGKEFQFYKNISMEMEYIFAWAILLILIILIVEMFVNIVDKKVEKNYL